MFRVGPVDAASVWCDPKVHAQLKVGSTVSFWNKKARRTAK